MNAKTIQICGTGSGVGKTVLVTALCRIFLQDGYRVCPFKAQNMALNSFVTKESGEIGRAQAVQAQACRIEPSVDMNPILIKPTSDQSAQIIVQGRPIGNMSAINYIDYKPKLKEAVKASFERLYKNYEIVVIEGAGSPAEINLKSHDIVNMKMAMQANAQVILIGDIDKGGVFAWIIGTLELLSKREKEMIKGIIINKFRGDKRLLKSGIDFLEKRSDIKVLGVIPYFKDIRIPEEDGIFYKGKVDTPDQLKIGVINLPHISNHTDFDSFKNEQVNFDYVDKLADLENLDVIVLPGTKNTMQDMKFLKKVGFDKAIKKHVDKKKILVGICGGFQMLGKKILDPLNIESNQKCIKGLGYFNFNTVFEPKKITQQIEARFIKNNLKVSGYEIHHGRTVWNGHFSKPMFIIEKRGNEILKVFDGAYLEDFQIWGTHIHGIFDNYAIRQWFLNLVGNKLGIAQETIKDNLNFDKEIDKLSDLVRKNLDIKYIYRILNRDV